MLHEPVGSRRSDPFLQNLPKINLEKADFTLKTRMAEVKMARCLKQVFTEYYTKDAKRILFYKFLFLIPNLDS